MEERESRRKGVARMTFCELRKKDIICIGDGRLLGRASDLEFDAATGQVRALIVPGGTSVACFFHGDRGMTAIPWQQIACIGDDVILVSQAACRPCGK